MTEKRGHHMNFLELREAFLAMKAFLPSQRGFPVDGQHYDYGDCLHELDGCDPVIPVHCGFRIIQRP